MKYNIYDVHPNFNTKNFGGEYVVDGENGRYTYPFSWPECLVRRLYEDGLSSPPEIIVGKGGYCDRCCGITQDGCCRMIQFGDSSQKKLP